jgi:hypothetical protein
VRGAGGRPHRALAAALLALPALASVPLGVLAAAGAAGLQPLRRPVLLVTQQEEHRLQ